MTEEFLRRRTRIEAPLLVADLSCNPATGQYERAETTAGNENWPCGTEEAAEEAGLTTEDLAWYEELRRAEDR